VIKCFAQRLKQNGVRGKKMVVAVMRKLIHIVFAVLKSGNRLIENMRFVLDFINQTRHLGVLGFGSLVH